MQIGYKVIEKAKEVISILGPDWGFGIADDPTHSYLVVFMRNLPDGKASIQMACRPSDLKGIEADVLAEKIKAFESQALAEGAAA